MFLALLFLLLPAFSAFALRPPHVVRTQRELEQFRARHASVPVVGVLFRDSDHDSVAALLKAKPQAHDEVLIGVHAPTVSEFSKWNATELGTRVALTAPPTTRRARALGATCFFSLRDASFREHAAPKSVALVYWRAEQELVAATFATTCAERNPGVPHVAVAHHTTHGRELGLARNGPTDPQRHTLLFFENYTQARCVAYFDAAAELHDAYTKCLEL